MTYFNYKNIITKTSLQKHHYKNVFSELCSVEVTHVTSMAACCSGAVSSGKERSMKSINQIIIDHKPLSVQVRSALAKRDALMALSNSFPSVQDPLCSFQIMIQ
jgi:hypothetical protein